MTGLHIYIYRHTYMSVYVLTFVRYRISSWSWGHWTRFRSLHWRTILCPPPPPKQRVPSLRLVQNDSSRRLKSTIAEGCQLHLQWLSFTENHFSSPTLTDTNVGPASGLSTWMFIKLGRWPDFYCIPETGRPRKRTAGPCKLRRWIDTRVELDFGKATWEELIHHRGR